MTQTGGYGKGAVGSDGNRGIHGQTYAGEDAKMPDTAFEVGGITVPSNNLLGQPSMNGPMKQQMLPDPPLPIHLADTTSQMNGPSGYLGQDMNDGLKDDDYPHLGTVSKQGMPDGYAGDVPWAGVAPLEYPDFPKDKLPQKIADGIENVLPLT